MLGVTLIAMDVKDEQGKGVAAGEPFPAEVNPTDGTFVVPGPDGSGILPGRYRVALILKPTATAVLAAREKAGKKKSLSRDTDFFKNRFSAGELADRPGPGDLLRPGHRPGPSGRRRGGRRPVSRGIHPTINPPRLSRGRIPSPPLRLNDSRAETPSPSTRARMMRPPPTCAWSQAVPIG